MKKALLRFAMIFGVAVAIAAVCLTNTGTMLIISLPIEIAGILLSFLARNILRGLKDKSVWMATRKKTNRQEYRNGFRDEKNA